MKVAQFLAAGGTIYQGESPALNPPPAKRSTKIDPETILKRRKPVLTRAERNALRKLAEAHAARIFEAVGAWGLVKVDSCAT